MKDGPRRLNFAKACRRRIDRGLAICLDFRNSFRCSVSAIGDQSLSSKLRAPIFSERVTIIASIGKCAGE